MFFFFVGDLNCAGAASEERSCNTDPCIEWSEWGDFDGCTRTCGGGVRTRRRFCINGEVFYFTDLFCRQKKEIAAQMVSG